MHTSDDGAEKVAVVTGATSGLGEAAALALARLGWHVVVVGRDEARGRSVVERGAAEFERADMFSLQGVAALAARLCARHPRIDLLINNAGAALPEGPRTADGLERTFALNVAAPFVLTEALLPALEGGRVVNVVTGIPSGAKTTVDAIAGSGARGGMGSYVSNKLALLALTRELAARHPAITFVALHPGVIPETRFTESAPVPSFLKPLGPFVARLFRFGSTLEQAAARYVNVSTAPVTSGGYYYEGVLRAAPRLTDDATFRAELHARLAALAPPPGSLAATA